MSNQITKRFIVVHDKLKDIGRIHSSRQLAIAIETTPQSLNQILKGKRDVTIMNVAALIEKFDINSEFMMTGEYPIFKEEFPDNNNHKEEDKIMYIPIAAHAGYCDQYNDVLDETEFQSFSLPGYSPRHGEHRCFDVTGDSMEPTLHSADKIICSKVNRDQYLHSLKDGYVYVIITKGDILVKRVENKIRQDGTLKFHSDNAFYKPHVIPVDEISEMWLVNLKLSPFMPDPSNIRNALHKEIDSMRETIKLQSDQLSMMNKSLECLLKKSR